MISLLLLEVCPATCAGLRVIPLTEWLLFGLIDPKWSDLKAYQSVRRRSRSTGLSQTMVLGLESWVPARRKTDLAPPVCISCPGDIVLTLTPMIWRRSVEASTPPFWKMSSSDPPEPLPVTEQ